MSDTFALSASPPDWVGDYPRDVSKPKGTAIDGVGVLHETDSTVYWKTFEVIELDDGSKQIRSGYYTKSGWKNKPLMLPTHEFNDLVTFAEGRIL